MLDFVDWLYQRAYIVPSMAGADGRRGWRAANRHITKLKKRKRLKGEIDATKKIISTLPPCDLRSEEGAIKVNHLKILTKQEEDYELGLERERVAKVVYEHKEMQPSTDTKECPICLEDIDTAECGLMKYFSCCGNGFCKDCDLVSKARGSDQIKSCPLCREIFTPQTDAAEMKRIRVLADRGRPWAQTDMGSRHLSGNNGCPIDRGEAFKWFNLAAETRFPAAIYGLSGIYKTGLDGVVTVTQSDEKAMSLMKEAADYGYSKAQWSLAKTYYDTGVEEYARKASFYATLAHSQDQDGILGLLGRGFLDGHGLTKSLYRAKYYLEKAAGWGDHTAYYNLANALIQLSKVQYEGIRDIPGHSCIPTVLLWARKALLNEDYKYVAAELIEELEEDGKQSCANCRKDAKCFSETLKTCVRCKAVWYCGRDCQLKHWKDGHKTDCIKKK